MGGDAMARRIEIPFEPDMADCKMVVKTKSGAICYIMDTCCKNFTKEDKLEADRAIMRIAIQSAMRKRESGLV